MRFGFSLISGAAIAASLLAFGLSPAVAEPPGLLPSRRPRTPSTTADARARRLVAQMTLDEKVGLLHSQFGVPLTERPQPKGALGSAGFNPGVARLGVPALQETDAGLGVANPRLAPFDATAMPSSLALAASFDTDLARRFGAAIASEARAMGFDVLLGPAANLIREPRGGRNFEYASEDPLLTGEIAGAEIAGIESQRIMASFKHFALNAQENGRIVLDARLDEAPFRESDLLALELAMDRGHPSAVMSSYNRVNGRYASENAHLLGDIVKRDWAFPGWIMADWGGTHSTEAAALAGLDQESGEEDDLAVYFGAPLKAAVEQGRVPMARLDDMATRIVRSEIASGVFDDTPKRGGSVDLAAHARLAQTIAARGMVLLKNADGVLPLDPKIKKILLVGGHADIGVLSGGGSSQVQPIGSIRFEGIPPKLFYGRPRLVDPSPPLAALKRALPDADVGFDDGHDRAATARRARDADMVVVFADRWSNESLDLEDLTLPFDQDGLISAVAAANPRTIVVLETPGGVTMPWLAKVAGVMEAWYPGERGGEAIADVLLGKVDAGGRLPITFPASVEELPRPTLPQRGKAASYPREALKTAPFSVDYNIEGADVGYKWYLRTGQKPLFPFGFGLSYTRFAVSNLSANPKGASVAVAFDIKNVGDRAGDATEEVYLDGTDVTRRLIGWGHVTLAPGATHHVGFDVDPRFLANFDVDAHGWRVAAGHYTVAVRPDALSDGPAVEVALADRLIPARHGACGGATGGSLCVGDHVRSAGR